MASKRIFGVTSVFLGVCILALMGCNLLPSLSAKPSSDTTASANTASAPQVDANSMKEVQIIDPMYNMVAYTMSIPKNWTFEGTVLHGPGCSGFWSAVVYRAYSPDMSYGVQAIPTADFVWADDPRARPTGQACKIAPPISAADYAALVSIRMRPDSEVDSVESAPNEAKFQARIEKGNEQLAQQAAAMGNRNPFHVTGEMKRMRIHYVLNGHPEEEWIIVAMTRSHQPTSVIVNRPGQVLRTTMELRIDSQPYVSGQRAPQGKLLASEALFRAIGESVKENPQYTAAYTKYMQDVTNRAIAASWATTNAILESGRQAQAQRTQQAQEFLQNMQKQGDVRRDQFNQQMAQKSQNAADFNAQMDRRSGHARDVSDYLLDQQLYVNPTTGQTQTQSNQYNHTYSNGSGPGSAVVQTNSPNSNPQGVLPGNWTELQPIHH